MAAISDNKYDTYSWIEKVIDSCKDYHHFRAVDNLISNFHDIYDDWQLTGALRVYSSDRYYKRKK